MNVLQLGIHLCHARRLMRETSASGPALLRFTSYCHDRLLLSTYCSNLLRLPPACSITLLSAPLCSALSVAAGTIVPASELRISSLSVSPAALRLPVEQSQDEEEGTTVYFPAQITLQRISIGSPHGRVGQWEDVYAFPHLVSSHAGLLPPSAEHEQL